MIQKKTKNLIKKTIENLQGEGVFPLIKTLDFEIEFPKEKKYGDLASNIALILAKEIKKEPMEIAITICEKLNLLNEKLKIFEKIEAVKPGFINFFISKIYLQKQVGEILKRGEKFGQLNIGKGKKIQVEFISANPTGPLTVGNSRGGPFGDALANLLKSGGFKVKKAYYINDYGMQILTLGHSILKDKEGQYKGDYIELLHKRIKEKDPYKAGEKGAKIILNEMIKKTLKKFGIKFDEWISESFLHKKSYVEKILKILKTKNLTYEKEGAIWFKSTKFGDLRDRVLVKKDGWKTYLAGDIALHYFKFKKKKYDKVINIWGADHLGDVPGLKAGVAALGYAGKLDIILLQFVTLFEKKEKLKMSKRLGIYVTLEELLNQIPADVIKFFFLERSPDTHLNFDLDLAKEQSLKNPVFYIQYALARIESILKKWKEKNNKDIKVKNLYRLEHPKEIELIKELIKFPMVIEKTLKDYQVQRIPRYAFEVASFFHQFYENCQVISEEKPLALARLALVLATKIVLKKTLNLMGISTPQKM